MDLVSLIITTHHRPHLLRRAIGSARLAGSNVEIIVVDDASHDETAEVCAGFNDIRYVRADRNQRVAGARNLGILASRAEYLAFLDDDDVRLPSSLDLQLQMLGLRPEAALVYGRALIGDQRGDSTGAFYPARCPQGDVFWELLTHNFIPSGSVVFRRSRLMSAGLLDARIPGLDDWDLWIRFAELHPVIATDRPVMIWRQSTPFSDQGTSRAAELVALSTRQFRQQWMRLPRCRAASPALRRRAWRGFTRHMASHLIWQAARAAGGGDYRGALGNLLMLWRRHLGGACLLAGDPAARQHLAARLRRDGRSSPTGAPESK